MGSKTTLTKASPKSISLRATVPIAIVEQIGLKEGDILDWSIEFIDGKKVIIVKKVEG